MSRTIASLCALLCLAAPAARADDAPDAVHLAIPGGWAPADAPCPPGDLCVSDAPSAPSLRRARAEIIAGTVVTALAAVGQLVALAALIGTQVCDTTPYHDSDCVFAYGAVAFVSGAIGTVEGAVGVPLLAIGIARRSDALLALRPSLSARGGGLGLSLSF